MSYADIDPIITDWVKRHSLNLVTQGIGQEVRSVYISSLSGDCFQIWIENPMSDHIILHADCVEGAREDDLPRDWSVHIEDLGASLDEAMLVVLEWMRPSTRFVPVKKSA